MALQTTFALLYQVIVSCKDIRADLATHHQAVIYGILVQGSSVTIVCLDEVALSPPAQNNNACSLTKNETSPETLPKLIEKVEIHDGPKSFNLLIKERVLYHH